MNKNATKKTAASDARIHRRVGPRFPEGADEHLPARKPGGFFFFDPRPPFLALALVEITTRYRYAATTLSWNLRHRRIAKKLTPLEQLGTPICYSEVTMALRAQRLMRAHRGVFTGSADAGRAAR